MKKDHRSSTNALKKEVDALEGRLSSYGGNDDRQRQRQYQYRQSIRQAEDLVSEITSEIESLGNMPDDEKEAVEEIKNVFLVQKDHVSNLRDQLETAKVESDRRARAARTENANVQQKRERVAARLNKLITQRDSLVAANSENSKNAEQRDADRQTLLASRNLQERDLLGSIQRVEAQRMEIEAQASQLAEYLYQLEVSQQIPNTQTGPVIVPSASEAPLTGYATTGASSSRNTSVAFSNNATSAMQPPVGTPPLHSSRRSSVLQQKSRGRSSSMLSNVSGFTDDEIGANSSPAAFREGTRMNSVSSGGDPNNDENAAQRQGSEGSSGSSHRRPHSGSGSGILGSKRSSPGIVGTSKPSPIGTGRDRNASQVLSRQRGKS